ncbi:DUF916 domain-containing protein [Salirhabdus sp. Marseille-P4669]|uniref:DUF916 domain-containing protein n=1 Tax=Salirhabdus sp. Marseille-P4669 TaxID=2042310 RepID=UPI000C7B1730|nr:DUF916 domain-containing protein [Salirhabdus sp. Marseille-P4669]
MKNVKWIFIFIIFFQVVNQNVFAQQNEISIEIEPVFPENQDEQIKGYFKLNVRPNDQQALHIKVKNKREVETTVSIEGANAFTNPNGGILYRENVESEDSLLLDNAIRLGSLIEVDKEVVLKPHEEREIPILVNVPDIDEGTILGGILVKTIENTEENRVNTEDGEANFKIDTEVVHAIAIQLDLPNSASTDFELGQAGFNLLGPSIEVEMKNNAQKLQRDISGTFEVTDETGTKLFDGQIPSFMMAPSTQINYPVDWTYETLEKGLYTIAVELTVDNQKYTANEQFRIGEEEIEEYVERTQPVVPQANTEDTSDIPVWVWILAGAIVLAGIMFWLGSKNRKQ